MNRIVTHAGVFHADELAGTCLIQRLFPEIPVERTYTPDAGDFNDPEVVVLDIGRRFEPDLLNFDHHQDSSLPSAAGLVLRHFYAHEPRLGALLDRHFIGYIDRVDRGEVVENADSPPTINSIIRACNNLPGGFEVALQIMRLTLAAQIETAAAAIRGEDLWASTEKDGFVAIHDSQEFVVGWHEHAERDGIRYFVTPNARGGYQITSRDSKQWPIPADPRQTFLHNSGFIAAYASKEEAVNHATSL